MLIVETSSLDPVGRHNLDIPGDIFIFSTTYTEETKTK